MIQIVDEEDAKRCDSDVTTAMELCNVTKATKQCKCQNNVYYKTNLADVSKSTITNREHTDTQMLVS